MTAAMSTGRQGAGLALATLAAGQFVMTLDTSVMNVSIATVAHDVGTDVTGIQTAITMYTLVMASLMITGGKIGQILGNKRAFVIGGIVYACGSLTTALAHSLPVLLVGWSLLEGMGAALILPSIVALVATNFAKPDRPKAYGLLAAAAAVTVAIGPLIGGLATTYASWRYVFVGEVVVMVGVLMLAKRIHSSPPDPSVRLDLVGTAMSAAGMGTLVYGLLRSGTWGFIQPKPGAPTWVGLSPAFWLAFGGLALLGAFLSWERRVVAAGREPLVDPTLLKNRVLRSSLAAFFFQFMLQAGLFFLIALYLGVALGLSAISTALRIMPFSVTLMLAAVGVPRLLPHTSPRRIVRAGFSLMVTALTTMVVLLRLTDSTIVTFLPLLIAGLGTGALASQLASVAVSSVPDERSGEIGGLQNTGTNLGASIATAFAGAMLVAALSTSFFNGLQNNLNVPPAVYEGAQTQLVAGVPFVSDRELTAALDKAGVPADVAQAVIDTNTASRVKALQVTLALLALMGVIGIVTTGGIPDVQPADAAGAVLDGSHDGSAPDPVPDPTSRR